MISFDPEKHAYTNDLTGEVYMSCTQLLNKYKKKFDVELHASRVARKRGVDTQLIKDEWSANTKSSCDYGTMIHEAIEDSIINGLLPTDEKMLQCVNSLKSIQPFKDKNVKSEHLLYNHEFKLAGTSDIIEDVGKDKFNVYDFKTNKKFSFSNDYNEYLLDPIHHLSACDYSTYSLQLSLYATLYSNMTDRKVNRLGILYWDREKENWEFYPVPYMKHEVLILLTHYKKNHLR